MRKLLLPVLGAISFAILGSASGCSEEKSAVDADAKAVVAEVSEEVATMAADETPAAIAIEKKDYKVKISTSFGDMIAILYDETPQHRDNFVKLANEGFYNDLLFHRVMNNFMVQGGDPESRDAQQGKRLGSGGPGYTVEAEMHDQFFHQKGALAAARQPDQVNPEKRSSGSQFYIVQGKTWPESQLAGMEGQKNARRDSTNLFKFTDVQRKIYGTIGGYAPLDGEYTVFGQVIEGMEVIDKIAANGVDPQNRPIEDIKMTVTVLD
ncbi:MAG: cyclophilin family peptidyl-prolyl cis-trans isomerase [Litorivivens sp.]|jgi:cyclophilin family peptidyl-prolyl cis-trans isomerase